MRQLPTTLEDESPTHFIFLAVFLDLETGYNFPRLYRQRKSGGPGGKMASDRKEDISFQTGQSKAQRNAIDKSMPPWLVKRAIEAAKSSAAEKYKEVEKWIPNVLKGFEQIGVTKQQLEIRLDKLVEAWTPYDILTLSLIRKAIRERESTVAEEFPTKPEGPEQPAVITVDGDGVVLDQTAQAGSQADGGAFVDTNTQAQQGETGKPDASATATPTQTIATPDRDTPASVAAPRPAWSLQSEPEQKK